MIFGVSLAEVVDAVIGLTLLESIGLVVWHWLTGRGLAPHDYLLNLLSGLFLMFALRCAVHQTGSWAVAAALLAAGTAHGADLLLRWRLASAMPGAGRQPAHPLPSRTHRSVSP